MDSDNAPNGRTYVKFGPHDTDEMPLAWAERMLTELHQSNPSTFGKLLQMAAGIAPRKRS